MKRLIKLIDQDVVASLNNLRRVDETRSRRSRVATTLLSIYAPRLTWVKLIAPLLLAAIPLYFLRDPIKTYWMFALFAMILIFFCLYFYRMALIRQRWLDNRQVDEFGSYSARADDLYEAPSD